MSEVPCRVHPPLPTPHSPHPSPPVYLRVVFFNVRAMCNVIPFLDKCDADVFVFSEADVSPDRAVPLVLDLQSRRLSYMFFRDPPRESRLLVVFKSSWDVAWQRLSVTGIAFVLTTPSPILVLCAYIPPLSQSHKEQFDEFITSTWELFPGLPLLCGGDLNVTTNRYPRAVLYDVTPSAPNFRGTTRPSVVLVSEAAIGRVTARLLDPCGLGDGHVPIEVQFEGWSRCTLSAKLLMRRWTTIGELSSPIVRDQHAIRDIQLEAVLQYVAHPRSSNWRQVDSVSRRELGFGRCRPDPRQVRGRLQVWLRTGAHRRLALGDLVRRLTPGRVPSWVSTSAGGSLCFQCVEQAYVSVWEGIWGLPHPSAAARYIPLSVLSEEQRLSNRVFMASPLTLAETRLVVLHLDPAKTTGDFSIHSLCRWAKTANAQEWEALVRLLNHITPVEVLITLIPKTTDLGNPLLRRPLGALPLVFMIRRKVLVRRFYQLSIPWHPANFTFRKGRSPGDILTGIHALLTAVDWREPVGILGADVVKAYDTVPHDVIDSILVAYGLDTPLTLYSELVVLNRLVLAQGLSRCIPVLRGFIQGDPWACPSFAVLADCACRYFELHLIPRMPFYILVDDIQGLVRSWEEVERVLAIYSAFYGQLGMRVAKYRVIGNQVFHSLRRPSSLEVAFSTVGKIFGSCLHMDSTSRCSYAVDLQQRCSHVLGLIARCTSCELTRFQHVVRYIQPMVTYFPSPCIPVRPLQDLIHQLSFRGVPNPKTPMRGIKEAQYVPMRLGGKGVPHIASLLDRCAVRLVKRALAYPHPDHSSIVRALTTGAHHRQNLFYRIGLLRPLNLDQGGIREIEVRPCQFYPQDNRSLPVCVATDASVTPMTTRLAVVAQFESCACEHAVELVPSVRSSHLAELCAMALAVRLYPGCSVVTDSMSCCSHISLLLSFPRDQWECVLCRDVNADLSRTVLQSISSVRWIRGHSLRPRTLEEHLNIRADTLTHVDSGAVVHIAELRTAAVNSFEYVSPLLLTRDPMLTRMHEGLHMGVVNIASLAFYCRPSGSLRLTPSIRNTVLSLRTRALFPLRLSSSLRCVCGCPLTFPFAHIMVGCVSPDHTTQVAQLRSCLPSWAPTSPPWWLNLCFSDPCVCLPDDFSCAHLFSLLLPLNAPLNIKLLCGVAHYVHARLEVCYPRNLQLRYMLR